jgi:serine/threonine protein kinase
VLFLGACAIPGQSFIVSEYLPNGDLEKLLHNKSVELTMFSRMRMAKDAALGMNWLHCSHPQFIHRDLKSSNLLVDENGRVKVCDFGLSQIKQQGEYIKDMDSPRERYEKKANQAWWGLPEESHPPRSHSPSFPVTTLHIHHLII